MKTFIVVQYWPQGNTMTIKFQSDSLAKASTVLSVFQEENPNGNFRIVKTIE